MPPRTLPLTLLRPFLDPRSKERFVDLRKARDLDDLGKQKQALLGFMGDAHVDPHLMRRAAHWMEHWWYAHGGVPANFALDQLPHGGEWIKMSKSPSSTLLIHRSATTGSVRS